MIHRFSKSYYINLSNRKDRNDHFLSEIQKSKRLNGNISRYEAVDGKKIKLNEITDDIITSRAREALEGNTKAAYGYDLTYGGLGCALSHRNIYLECVEKGYESVLILEDDVSIDPLIDKMLRKANKLDHKSFDLLYLGCNKHHYPRLKPTANPLFNQVLSNLHGTFGYLVTNTGAQKLLDLVFPISVQIDSEILKHIMSQNLTAFLVNPKVVHSLKFGSDVQIRTRVK